MKNLVYVRPWNKDQFSDLASKKWSRDKFVLTSEHSSVDESGLYNGFYKGMDLIRDHKLISILSEEQIRDVIDRCRLLRSVDSKLARELVFAMEYAIEKILDKYSPKVILSITVDSYILHLFTLACDRRRIEFVGLVPTFVNGYFRVTKIGERQRERKVTVDECESVLKNLDNENYKPGFLPINLRSQNRKSTVNKLKNIIKPIWFFLRRYISGDLYNYHYYSSQLVSYKYCSLTPISYIGVTLNHGSEIFAYSNLRKIVFIPLQMSPEATVDYWSSDKSWIDYENKIIALIEILSRKYCVVVKEHPNVIGQRTRGFYKALQDFHTNNKCVLVDAHVNSNLLLSVTDGLLLCTGSVGFEAALRGIPVYTDSSPFHLCASICHPISELLAGDLQNRKIMLHNDKIEMVEFLLSAMFKGVFINDGTWRDVNAPQGDIASALEVYCEHS